MSVFHDKKKCKSFNKNRITNARNVTNWLQIVKKLKQNIYKFFYKKNHNLM